ncbi:NAD-dependent succinate-semialdehyde dehydrogenase [Myxococcus sp. K38C18041901]|uniref:NAD-dependent succinate-semialdehyde dehydrogenase n=1 Tax=Myxococcus guangdongensis TaxID=2906760 RepID=UPI0020A8069C|nr:NAD-dependent succinate-semialdehyde dehydrogenase [Myxococcus guangdongensis]MCP3064757.1 NAD-dependent succinate-semialdehyde dehydrogenase [Myxococcus guangdongensis]
MAIATIDPTSGKTLRTFDALTPEQLESKLQLASDTFRAYRQTPFAERARWMRRAAELLDAGADHYGRIMTEEMGKPLEAAKAEAKKCATACRYYVAKAEGLLKDRPIDVGGDTAFVRYQPLGPVLAIMPWNFPFWQVVRFAAPALMAGNVGLLKHAHNVPQCALALETLFLDAGFPQGAFQTLLIETADVNRVIEDARVRAVTLTGSEGAGRAVGASAGKSLKKVVLELGGSDPFIVMPSADLDKAVETAASARLINNGQSCIAAKRFIVAEPIAAEFERRFVERLKKVTVGDPMDPKTDLGPLATPGILQGLHAQVEASVKAGARLLIGGKPLERPGNFYPPTVLADPPPSAPAFHDELFGPVATLLRARDVEHALELANATPFGLGASVWTRDAGEQRRFIDGIESGMVFVNQMVVSDARLPFGGVKNSGHGRELADLGIHEFLNAKTVRVASGAQSPPARGGALSE